MPKRIDSMWAFVSVDPATGDEGIIATQDLQDGVWVPLITSDEENMRLCRGFAEAIARGGRDVRLIRLHRRTDIETIPAGKP